MFSLKLKTQILSIFRQDSNNSTNPINYSVSQAPRRLGTTCSLSPSFRMCTTRGSLWTEVTPLWMSPSTTRRPGWSGST